MSDPWEATARALDALYRAQPDTARTQLKNQPVLLVLPDSDHGFFPVRRLVDGQQGRDMDLPKSEAQELQRYRHDLRSHDYEEIGPSHPDHPALLDALHGLLARRFDTVPSPAAKTFWRVGAGDRRHILDAFDSFDRDGPPEGFGPARSWFVTHPDTDRPYPAKVIWGLATGKRGADFTAHQARDGLRRLGFLCAQLDKTDLPPDPAPQTLLEGAERQVTGSRRERNPVARKLCIEHHTRNGRLACVACDIDFGETYGMLGAGFIHVHHLDQLADTEGEREIDPVRDLVPVCPNCHAMIHRGGKNRPIEDIRHELRVRRA